MVWSLQQKGHAFESMCVCVCVFFTLIDIFKLINIDVPRPLSHDIRIILFQMVDA